MSQNSSFFWEQQDATHVAGIACGNGIASHGKYMGIAPESHIISVKILDQNGRGNSVQALSGIQWIIENREKYNIRIVNLSIGTTDKTINVPLVKAVNSAWDKGIIMIAAAGNADGRRGMVTSPGISSKIITVGSYKPQGMIPRYDGRRLGLFRRSILFPDVLAPGTEIVSCLSLEKDAKNSIITDNAYITMSGTSMATPMVAGAAALLLSKNPALTPDEIKVRLWESGLNPGNQRGCGLMNIETLLNS